MKTRPTPPRILDKMLWMISMSCCLILVGYLLLWLPVVASSSIPLTQEEGWTTYQAPFYSFDYPSDWKIEVSEKGDYVTIHSPERNTFGGDRIEFAFLGYEITESQDLLSWYDMYYRAAHGDLPPNVEVLSYQRPGQEDENGVWQRLHVAVINELGASQAIMLAHGHLVLSIGAYTHDGETTETLVKIADSLRFSSNAPRTLSELYATDQPHPSLESILAEIRRGGVVYEDIVTRDARASENLPVLPLATPDPEFLEMERAYQKLLDEQGLPEIGDSRESHRKTVGLSRILMGVVTNDRKALPSNWWSPISTTVPINVDCSSPFHTGRAAMAIDIGLPEGTQVLAAQGGTIIFAGWDNSGYGYLMRIATDNVNVAGENRKYWHNYAHLKQFRRTSGSVARGEWIADSGSTGNSTNPHLHLHITHDVNKNDTTQHPVDLSPLVGFRPNMSYPVTGTCGQIVARTSDLLIVEPVMFTERYHPRDDHYWFCYTTLNRTTECYMEGVPNNGKGWDPLNTSQSPELRYNNVFVPQAGTYYLWVCGRGGSSNDDSLHMGYGGTAPSSSQRMTGYHQNAWVWQSVRMDSGRPYLNLPLGQVAINIWMREDGMRIDRVLLTREQNYNPTNNIRCGGY